MEKISAAEWERKWKRMVDRDRNKRLQNALLGEKLREKKELEEATECTFCPKIQTKAKPGEAPKRSREELLQLLLPVISEEEAVLRELGRLEAAERASRAELARIACAALAGPAAQSLGDVLGFYRDERLKDVSALRHAKVGVVGRLLELERKFNFVCSSECIDPRDLARVGFEIDNSRRIREEIARSVDNYDTLKDRSRVSAEFEGILKAASAAQRERIKAAAEPHAPPPIFHGRSDPGHSPMYARHPAMAAPPGAYVDFPGPFGLQVPALRPGGPWQLGSRCQAHPAGHLGNRW